MKTTWISPNLTVYGSVEDLTEVSKDFGANDGYQATITIANTVVGTVPVGNPPPGTPASATFTIGS